MVWKNMANFKNKWKYAPNCQLHPIVLVEGLGLLGSEGAGLDVDGSKVEDNEDGKLACKREYAWVWHGEHKLRESQSCVEE